MCAHYEVSASGVCVIGTPRPPACVQQSSCLLVAARGSRLEARDSPRPPRRCRPPRRLCFVCVVCRSALWLPRPGHYYASIDRSPMPDPSIDQHTKTKDGLTHPKPNPHFIHPPLHPNPQPSRVGRSSGIYRTARSQEQPPSSPTSSSSNGDGRGARGGDAQERGGQEHRAGEGTDGWTKSAGDGRH
jgi:hypothetical protein